MQNEIPSVDSREDGTDIKIARDILNTMSSYRIDPAKIRYPGTGRAIRSGRSVVVVGELAPAVESTTPGSRQTVAVKKLMLYENDFNVILEPFAYELGLMTTLSHPNVVRLIGFVEDIQNQDIRFILPWEGNGNIRDFLASGEWEIPERVSLIQDTVSGLEYLHTRQPPIRHGDLKSPHILVSSSYRAIISGFWSARIMSNVGEKNKDDHWLCSFCERIDLGDNLYTLRWAAPELLMEELAGLPADMWALGLVCWEIATGRTPFGDVKNQNAIIMHIIKGDLPAVREHAALCQVLQLCNLMSDCWMPNPAERIDASTFRKKARFLPCTTPSGDTSDGQRVRSATLQLELGRMHDLQNDSETAVRYYVSALDVASQNGNETDRANALISLGDSHNTRSMYPKAEVAFKEAHEIYSRIGNDLGAANASAGLGRIYNARSRYSEAEETFREAHEIHSRIGNDVGVANALIGLGEVYESQARYSEAEKAFMDAHELHSLIGNDLGVANVLIGLGETYGAQSRYPEAEKAFTGAQKIHFRIGNYVRAANALVYLGEIYHAQSKYFEAEKAFEEVSNIVSRIGDNLIKATALNDRQERYDAHSGDSGDEECSKEAAEHHVRVETYIEEPFKEEPEIHSRIHDDSGSATAAGNPQQASFIQELASIESVSMPSTHHIVDLILALAKTAPTAIRNKHQLYRVLIISRDLCCHLHCVAHSGGQSSNGLNVLEQCWEIIDNLERALSELIDIVSQETLPFGTLSLATWNNSRMGLSRIYGELTAPPFNTYGADDSAKATLDKYFDDCSWMSLLLLEGIERPVQNMHPEAEEGFSGETQNVIDRLNYLVNETKLNGNTDEPTRELFIDILSGVAKVTMNGPDNRPVDFWNGADRALQDIDLEKSLSQDLVDSLRDSWSGFVDRQIQQASTSRTPAPNRDPIIVSLPQELTFLDHEIPPATEPLVLLLHSLGRGAPTATRNKHKIYAIVSRARDICNHILAMGVLPEVGGLETLDKYYSLIDALEGVLLDVAKLLPAEQVSFGLDMCESWSEFREEFRKILNRLYEPPFRLEPSAPEQELMNNFLFDDYYWLSLLLEEGIEKASGPQDLDIEEPPAPLLVREGLRYLENEIKCGNHEETTRELVIDIASRLYEALSASVSEKESLSDAALPIRTAEPHPPITSNKTTLITALSIAFSVLDLDSSLESQDIYRLTGNWWGISHSSPRRRPGNPGESKLAETGSSGQVEPVGQEDRETSQDPTKSQDYCLQLHEIISRRNLAYSEDTVPRDNVRDESWIVTIHISGEDLDSLRLTGTGLSKRKAKDAVARLALIVLGEIVVEE